tara:strand:- start:19 stop:441 length:423 start_codon:yes stop_codon:yes gene_type:complete
MVMEKYTMSLNISIEDLLEIDFNEPDDFLKIKETLTRIGVSSRKEKKLFQSCHILHKRGRYYIVHFKELFALDGLHSDITDSDIARRNKIAMLLEEWGLLTVINKERIEENVCGINQLKILSYKEKGDWELCPKYHIGRK